MSRKVKSEPGFFSYKPSTLPWCPTATSFLFPNSIILNGGRLPPQVHLLLLLRIARPSVHQFYRAPVSGFPKVSSVMLMGNVRLDEIKLNTLFITGPVRTLIAHVHSFQEGIPAGCSSQI